MALDPIEQGLAVSEQYLSSLDAYVKNQLEHSFIDKIPGVDIVIRNVEAQLAKAENEIFTIDKLIKTQIEPLLKNAVPDAIAIITGLARTLDDNLSKLVSNIATTEDVLVSAITTIKGLAPELARWVFNEITGGFGATALNVLREIEQQGTGGIDEMLDEVLKTSHLPPWLRTIVADFRGRNAEWQALALPALAVAVILAIVNAIEEPIKTVIGQDFWNQYPTKVADAGTIIEALARGIIEPDHAKTEIRKTGLDFEPFQWLWEVNKHRLDPPDVAAMFFRKEFNDTDYYREMHRNGFPTEYAGWYLRSQIRLLGEGQIRDAFLRGIIDTPEHDRRLELYGYTAETAEAMRTLYFFIPPVADLIQMGIRNVFNHEI